jgi:hypothetical protein
MVIIINKFVFVMVIIMLFCIRVIYTDYKILFFYFCCL